MEQKIKNVFSRKFIISLCLVAGGIGTAFKVSNNPSVQIAGIITACIAGIAYAWIEGKVDMISVEGQVIEVIKQLESIQGLDKEE